MRKAVMQLSVNVSQSTEAVIIRWKMLLQMFLCKEFPSSLKKSTRSENVCLPRSRPTPSRLGIHPV